MLYCRSYLDKWKTFCSRTLLEIISIHIFQMSGRSPGRGERGRTPAPNVPPPGVTTRSRSRGANRHTPYPPGGSATCPSGTTLRGFAPSGTTFSALGPQTPRGPRPFPVPSQGGQPIHQTSRGPQPVPAAGQVGLPRYQTPRGPQPVPAARQIGPPRCPPPRGPQPVPATGQVAPPRHPTPRGPQPVPARGQVGPPQHQTPRGPNLVPTTQPIHSGDRVTPSKEITRGLTRCTIQQEGSPSKRKVSQDVNNSPSRIEGTPSKKIAQGLARCSMGPPAPKRNLFGLASTQGGPSSAPTQPAAQSTPAAASVPAHHPGHPTYAAATKSR